MVLGRYYSFFFVTWSKIFRVGIWRVILKKGHNSGIHLINIGVVRAGIRFATFCVDWFPQSYSSQQLICHCQSSLIRLWLCFWIVFFQFMKHVIQVLNKLFRILFNFLQQTNLRVKTKSIEDVGKFAKFLEIFLLYMLFVLIFDKWIANCQ